MLNRMHDERGIAMVVALLVTMVVTLISIAVVAQSVHDLDASGNDRRRLLSVNAAEAGTNAWYAHLQTEAAELADVLRPAGRDDRHRACRGVVQRGSDLLRDRRHHRDDLPLHHDHVSLVREDPLHGHAERHRSADRDLRSPHAAIRGFRGRDPRDRRHDLREPVHGLRRCRERRRHLHPRGRPGHQQRPYGERQHLRARGWAVHAEQRRDQGERMGARRHRRGEPREDRGQRSVLGGRDRRAMARSTAPPRRTTTSTTHRSRSAAP